MTDPKKRLIYGLAALIVLGGVMWVFDQRSQKRTPDNETGFDTVNIVADTEKADYAPMQLAIEAKMFDEQKIRLAVSKLSQGAFAPEVLQNGSADLVFTTVGADLFNAMGRGAKFAIVADYIQNDQWIMVRKDLWDSGQVKSVRDLRGLTVRTSGEGRGNYYALGKLLEASGLTISDVETKRLDTAETVAALAAKQLDGAIIGEPARTRALDRGLAVMLPERGSNYQIAVLLASDEMMRRPNVLLRFLRAYVWGLGKYQQAFEKQEPAYSQTMDALTHLTGDTRELIKKMAWHSVDATGHPNITSMEDMQQFFYAQGLVDKIVPIEQYVRTEFLP